MVARPKWYVYLDFMFTCPIVGSFSSELLLLQTNSNWIPQRHEGSIWKRDQVHVKAGQHNMVCMAGICYGNTPYIIMKYMDEFSTSIATSKSSKYWPLPNQSYKVKIMQIQSAPWFIWLRRLLMLWSIYHHAALSIEIWQHETAWLAQTSYLVKIGRFWYNEIKGMSCKLLAKPANCLPEVYEIMLTFWAHKSPRQWATFDELFKVLSVIYSSFWLFH